LINAYDCSLLQAEKQHLRNLKKEVLSHGENKKKVFPKTTIKKQNSSHVLQTPPSRLSQ
jgi:hypothetical protein